MMRVNLQILSLALAVLVGVVQAESRDQDYRGKVFTEIRIDNDGIQLVDSAGNVMNLSTGTGDNGIGVGDRHGGTPGDNGALQDCADVFDKITKIGGSVTVEENECVDGDVVVMGGNATIRGKVLGSVTATGKVRVTASAQVRGNIAGREVIAEPGSDVWGSITETEFPWPPETTGRIESRPSEALVMFLILAIQLGAVLLVSTVLPTATDRIKEVYTINIFKALAIGFLAEILFLPAFVLLLITIIGIPVALVGMPLALLAAGVLGLAGFCLYASDYIKPKDETQEESRMMKAMTGFVILQAPVIGLFFFQMINVELAAVVFGIVAAILVFIVFTSSLGAALLTRFGTRDYRPPGARVTVTVRTEEARAGD